MVHPEDGAAIERIISGAETNSVMYNRRGDLTRHQDCDKHRRCHDDHRRDNCHSCEHCRQSCGWQEGATLAAAQLL